MLVARYWILDTRYAMFDNKKYGFVNQNKVCFILDFISNYFGALEYWSDG